MLDNAQKQRKASRDIKEEEMRKTERVNMKIHLNTSGRLFFDVQREMSVLAQPKQRQPATVYMSGWALVMLPTNTTWTFCNLLQPCQHGVTEGKRGEVCVHLQQQILTNVLRQSTVTTDNSDVTLRSARCHPVTLVRKHLTCRKKASGNPNKYISRETG